MAGCWLLDAGCLMLDAGYSSGREAQGTGFLSALIRNYGDVLTVIFFHHRDTEDTETRFLFAHREPRKRDFAGQASDGQKT